MILLCLGFFPCTQALAQTRIQVPVVEGAAIGIHVYLHADESGTPFALEADSLRPWMNERFFREGAAKIRIGGQRRAYLSEGSAGGRAYIAV